MMMSVHRLTVIAIVIAACSCSESLRAQSPEPDPARFANNIEEFVVWDSKNFFPTDAMLFVGSSSIRGWATANAFPGKPIINRGFGGSEFSDILYYYDKVIEPYAAKQVFLYEGDNDIASGKTPERVFADYQLLVSRFQADFPESDMVFISIKPSKARWNLWPPMAKANQLIREYAANHEHLHYADLASSLLDDEGKPKDVFVEDGLHLNEQGYALWREALAPYVGGTN